MNIDVQKKGSKRNLTSIFVNFPNGKGLYIASVQLHCHEQEVLGTVPQQPVKCTALAGVIVVTDVKAMIEGLGFSNSINVVLVTSLVIVWKTMIVLVMRMILMRIKLVVPILEHTFNFSFVIPQPTSFFALQDK